MRIDGRTLSHETSETIRRLAVRRVKEGERPSSVIESYGLCRTTIYKWLKAERRGRIGTGVSGPGAALWVEVEVGGTKVQIINTHLGLVPQEQKRQAVNQWIRTCRAYDAVIDFDKAIRNPGNPGTMRPAYDSGDNLHPNDAGYQAMADAIDLSLFKDPNLGRRAVNAKSRSTQTGKPKAMLCGRAP